MRSSRMVVLVVVGCLWAGCARFPRSLPAPPRPAAGYWFDAFRAARAGLAEPELLAGSAKVVITPRPGGRIGGHGFNKHSRGVLDDLYARVLYLDSGPEAVALVSMDVIGMSLPRIERIRLRVTAEHGSRIIIAATHNHFGPDTLGFWGPAAFGLLPVRSGIDPVYIEWLERGVARAILRAVATARPARLFAGRFDMPEGLAYNMREPGDVPREVVVLRAAGLDGFTIGTVVDYACHAEALQDTNRWLSADFPGVLYREVDAALGGVTLFFSGAAGGMIEPANSPDDRETERLAFRERLGGALAKGVIGLAISGMQEMAQPGLRVRSRRIEIPVQADGVLDLAIGLGLLDPRPFDSGRIVTEVALVDLGRMQLLTVPGEPTPEVGRALAGLLRAEYRMLITLGMDELAYILSDGQWNDPRFEYERSMSLGPEAGGILVRAVRDLCD